LNSPDYLALTTLWDFVQRALERRFGRGYGPAPVRSLAEQA